MKKTPLPDVNFWLALTFHAHAHHPSALAWFNALTDEVCRFCRLTQMAFLRLANNPKALPGLAVSVAEAWRLFDVMMTDPRIGMADKPPGLERAWRSAIAGRQFSPKLWNDAYLAGFAEAGDYEVVTFDQGFTQFPNAAVTVLK